MGDRLVVWAGECTTRLFGPVFALEASRIGRRLSTFIIRWLYLLILVSVLGVFYYTSGHNLYSSNGTVRPTVLTQFSENFFWVYSITQFLVLSTVVPALTAGAITAEKERKALGFLLVTPLSAKEIVLGKFAVRIGELIMLVLAGMPILALLQFLGGIEPDLVILATEMTLATVFSLSAISAAASVQMARTRDAVILAYAIPVVYVYISYPMGFLPPGWKSTNLLIAAGNPFKVARMGGNLNSDLITEAATSYIIFHVVVTVLAFAFAVVRLRGSDQPPVAAGAQPRGKLRRWIMWMLDRRTEARKHPSIGDNPVAWRETYVEPGSGGGPLRRLFMFAIVATIFLSFAGIAWESLLMPHSSYQYSYRYSPWKDFHHRTQVWVCGSTCGLGILMLLRATVRGASSVALERDRDTWSSLLGTPLTSSEILDGKWNGCVWGQRDMMYLLAGVWTIGVVSGSVNVLFLVPAAVGLIVYLNAFAWLGIRSSIVARNSRVAIARTVPAALFLGGGFWIVIGCCMVACAFGSAFRSTGGEGVIYLSALIAGATPVCVLAGSPAIDFELLNANSSRTSAVHLSLMIGWCMGVFGWTFIARYWSADARRLFAAEAFRPLRAPLSSLPHLDRSETAPTK